MFNHEHICLNYCYCSWVRIEQEETDQIREETRQRKSDSCSSINHFHSSILHSTTEHTSKLCYIHFPFILPPLCILKPASPTHAYFLLLYLCLLVALAPQMLCILLVCRKRRKGCIICTVQRDRHAESQMAGQTAGYSYANTERKPLLGKGSMHVQFPMMCHSIPNATCHAATQLPGHLNIADHDQPHVHPTHV